MKIKSFLQVAITVISIFLLQFAQAQQVDSTLVQIVMSDGNILFGIITGQTDDQIYLETNEVGAVIIPTADVIALNEIEAGTTIHHGELWEMRRLGGRYFLLPSGYGLKKGQWECQNFFFLFNQLQYGINDYISLSVGGFPFHRHIIHGVSEDITVWLNPKLSWPIIENQFRLSAGLFIAGNYTFRLKELDNLGMLYSTATLGSKDHNFSIGLGWSYYKSELQKYPKGILAGQTRIGKKTFLALDYYFSIANPSLTGFLFLGGRTAWDKISLDYGLGYMIDDSYVLPFPFIGIGVPFGKSG